MCREVAWGARAQGCGGCGTKAAARAAAGPARDGLCQAWWHAASPSTHTRTHAAPARTRARTLSNGLRRLSCEISLQSSSMSPTYAARSPLGLATQLGNTLGACVCACACMWPRVLALVCALGTPSACICRAADACAAQHVLRGCRCWAAECRQLAGASMPAVARWQAPCTHPHCRRAWAGTVRPSGGEGARLHLLGTSCMPTSLHRLSCMSQARGRACRHPPARRGLPGEPHLAVPRPIVHHHHAGGG